MVNTDPYIIDFEKHGDAQVGYISVADFSKSIPFDVKRTFWTTGTPSTITRGNHALGKTEEVLIAIHGEIKVITESMDGESKTWVLNSSTQGLFIPENTWIIIHYTVGAVQLVFTSLPYEEVLYIRDYKKFKK